MDLGHAGKDAPMLLQAEVVRLKRPRRLNEVGVVHQDGAEDESLGVHIGGQAFLEHDCRRRHLRGLNYVTWRKSHSRYFFSTLFCSAYAVGKSENGAGAVWTRKPLKNRAASCKIGR